MNRKFAHILNLLLLGLATLLANACAEDNLTGPNRPAATGKMVEVTLPFGMSPGIETTITTRAGEEVRDDNLSGIMVFIYEKESYERPASECRRLGWYLYSKPGTKLDHGTDEWVEEPGFTDRGKVKFLAPSGDCYIYLIGNATNAFLDFFSGIEGTALDDLVTLEGFRTSALPRWTGNMKIVNGYMPMVGKVNNKSGACTITDDGTITFLDDSGVQHTLSDNGNYTDGNGNIDKDNVFQLERLMSKVTVNIQSDPGNSEISFTPLTYRFMCVPQYVSPEEDAWPEEMMADMPHLDTEYQTFDTQSRNSFTVYLPESHRRAKHPCTTFAQREAVDKDANGKIIYVGDEVQGHYSFTNAPVNATYLEITGRYEGPGGGEKFVAGDTHYFIHMGDFARDMNDFSLERDHHYTYNITIKGVDDIYVEVQTDKEAPGAETIVFQGGIHVVLDAHYEQVEMRIGREPSGQVYVYADTPYGTASCIYDAVQQRIVKGESKELLTKLTSWMEFAEESQKGTLVAYPGPGGTKNIFQILDEFYAGGKTQAYYTGFVNEYYYESDPRDGTATRLRDFVNGKNRVFSIGSQLDFSRDEKSAIARSVFLIEQRAIASFYDLDNTGVAKYGVENTDEVGRMGYGTTTSTSPDLNQGLENTKKEIGTNASTRYGTVNWTTNGWLLNEGNSALVDQGAARMATAHTIAAQNFYDLDDRTITLHLTANALRGYSEHELVPHNERSEVNRPYSKFQVANQPYMVATTATSGSNRKDFNQVQTIRASEAKNSATTSASKYPGTGNTGETHSSAAWRLPNQRELALMIMALGLDLGYGGNYDDYTTHEWYYSWGNWSRSIGYSHPLCRTLLVHCRTTFGNSDYDQVPYGFIYNLRDKQMQMAGNEGNSIFDPAKLGAGQNNEGYGAVLPVRDVRQ